MPASVVQIKAIIEGRVAAVMAHSSARDEEVRMAAAGSVKEDRPDVVRVLHGGPGLIRRRLKRAVGLAEVQHAGLPRRAADEHVGYPVAVHVRDRDGRAVHALAARKEPLAAEFVHWLGPVGEVDASGVCVLGKQRLRVGGVRDPCRGPVGDYAWGEVRLFYG